jgi:hypothetical protein
MTNVAEVQGNWWIRGSKEGTKTWMWEIWKEIAHSTSAEEHRGDVGTLWGAPARWPE